MYVRMYVYDPSMHNTLLPSHLDNSPADHSAVRGHGVEVDVVVHVIGLPCNLREGRGRERWGTQQH